MRASYVKAIGLGFVLAASVAASTAAMAQEAAAKASTEGEAPQPATVPGPAGVTSPTVVPAPDADSSKPAVATGMLKREPANLTQFIAPDFCAAVVIHPSRILKSPMLASVPLDMMLDQAAKAPPGAGPPMPAEIDAQKAMQQFDPRKILRIVLLADPTPIGEIPVSPAVIVQFHEIVDGDQLFTGVWKDAKPADFQGAKYYTSKAAGMGDVLLAGHAASSRIILVAPEPTLKKMLTASTSPKPLLNQLRRTKLDHDLIVEVDVQAALALAKNAPPMPPPVAMIAQSLKTASLTLDLSGDTLSQLRLTAVNAEAAQQLELMLRMVIGQVAQQFDAAKKAPPKDMPPGLAEPLMNLGDQMIRGLSVTSSGVDVKLNLQMPKGLDKLPGQIMKGIMSGPGKLDGPPPSTPFGEEPAKPSEEPKP